MNLDRTWTEPGPNLDRTWTGGDRRRSCGPHGPHAGPGKLVLGRKLEVVSGKRLRSRPVQVVHMVQVLSPIRDTEIKLGRKRRV